MAAALGVSRPHYSDSERRELFLRICEKISSEDCTVESACAVCGIADTTFWYWRNKYEEFEPLFKEAIRKQNRNYLEKTLIPRARQAALKLLETQTVVEKTTKAERVTVTEGGRDVEKFVVTEQVQRERTWLPNATLVAMFSRAAFPEIVEPLKIEAKVSMSGDSEFLGLTPEAQEKILLEIQRHSRQAEFEDAVVIADTPNENEADDYDFTGGDN